MITTEGWDLFTCSIVMSSCSRYLLLILRGNHSPREICLFDNRFCDKLEA